MDLAHRNWDQGKSNWPKRSCVY